MGCVFSFFSPGGPYNLGWFKKAQRSEEQEAESGSTGDSNSVNASKLKQFDEESALLDAEAPVPISKPLEPEDKAEEPEEVVVIPTAAAPSPQSEQSITTEVTQKENSSEVDLPLKVAAVTKLQAGYRGYKTRKDLKQRKQQQRQPLKVETDEKNEPCLDIPTTTEEDSVPEEIETATKLQADVSGFQTNTNLEEEQLDKNVGDDVVDDDAVEKQEGNEADVISTEENAVSENSTPPVEERSLQEVAAAVTLQAGFRGYQTRKNLKVQKQQNKKEEEDQAQLSTSRPDSHKPKPGAQGTELEPKIDIEPKLTKEDEEKAIVKPAIKPRVTSPNSTQPSSPQQSGETEARGDIDSPSSSPSVVRRQKSGRTRSRAATSKYRSGLVIENQMSMDEMEKEIENEMMTNAAVKIQAGFRGFKTRKAISSQYGVSKNKRKMEESGEAGNVNVAAATLADVGASAEDSIVQSDPSASAYQCATRLSPVLDEGSEERDILPDEAGAASSAETGAAASGRPALATLRSHSFPGPQEAAEMEQPVLDFYEGEEDRLLNPEPDVDLDLDPDYINKAAVRIQKSFRGYRVRKNLKRPGKENGGNKGSNKTQKLISMKAMEEAHQQHKQELIDRLQNQRNDEFDENGQPEKAAAKIQASFRSYKERTTYQKKKKAAITLQANIRGFLTRKRLANLRRRSFQRRRSSLKVFQKELEDMKKVNDAATKIQAVFRGYQVRSKIIPKNNNEFMIGEQEHIRAEDE